MSNYPSNSGQPTGNPLPYPDRQRPAQPQQQQHAYASAGSNTSPTAGTSGGGLPYPDRPAKYSDYQQQSSSQPTYSQDSAPYRPPQQQEAPKAKPVAAEPQASTGPWPTPPSAFKTDEAPPRPPKVASYSENVGGSQAHYTSSDPYAMGNVAAALPTTSSPPPPPAAPYQASYQGSVYDQTPRPPPALSTGPQTVPPYMDPHNQFATPPPPSASPVFQGGQPVSIGIAPTVGAAAVGAAAVHSYSNPQSPITAPVSPLSQPYIQTTSPAPITAPYQQTQLDQKTKPYSSPPTTQGAQYNSSSTTSPPGPVVQGQSLPPQHATTGPNTQQTGYVSGPPVPGITPSSSFPPPPQTYRPSQFIGVPPHPGQIHSSGSVYIDGKEHPIPAFTHSIQTPSQCDPVLKEVYFGPYLRFTNVDLQRNLWLGSILLILPSNLPPPRLEFHQSRDFSHLQSAIPHCIYSYDNYSFFRYDLVMPIFPHEQKWTYAITTQGTQIWEFTIAGQQQQWRFIAWSCNDFSSSVKQEERDKLGFGTLWKDVMDRYSKEGAFHAQLGGGDQIYADRMWKEIPYYRSCIDLMTDF
jgi:PhoD related phosphatase